MSKGSGKRTKLVIEPKIQYSLVRQLVAHWTLHLAATLLLLTVMQVLLGGIFRPWQYHFDKIWPTLASLAVSLLFLLPVYIQSSLKLSNRFVGPIHRLRRELRSLADGQSYRELKFRESDYWAELADEFDNAVEALQKQVRYETSTPEQNVTPDNTEDAIESPATEEQSTS